MVYGSDGTLQPTTQLGWGDGAEEGAVKGEAEGQGRAPPASPAFAPAGRVSLAAGRR